MIGWVQLIVSFLCGLIGAFLGGWRVAYRSGQWKQRTDDRLAAAEGRLEKGNHPLGLVPVLDVRMQALMDDVREIKEQLRDWLPRLVTKEECARRHGHD